MGKPLYKSVSSCFKKSRYATETKAKQYAEKSMKARGGELRTYYCRVCMGFHITSKPVRDFTSEDQRSV